MKKYKLAILFTQPPFGTATSREGLDVLLAASAFCNEEQLAICFLNDGIFNLLANQLPENILQKDHISTFKLIELYELNHCFICQDSIKTRNLSNAKWLLNNLQFVPQQHIFDILQQAEKILTF
ncbi:tRNA 2-thiouridine(34) synthase TusC [Vespertiliibacter pulmonis]|uniref:tRNA 2-thiouridine synthesizing protein C n=1 Tax=Vespertiliibacter pulmonis TaxID=1443036 RepID=A0A3N4VLV2_9PAST|nr:sulfurtransferase complex subunit TusC [Vespertiliibacter pulmonis]QLB20766.1 tRNA 2-thiouridine(34) synthase TusC [Vespertiliibacter pulmonis]RPE82653.1 tRNA 2-thiouridine synthesizing protein C [Vespertiliibacter pulmonis]